LKLLLEDFGAIWHWGQFLLALLLLYQGLALFYPLTSVPFGYSPMGVQEKGEGEFVMHYL
jgi:hypothetical protein